MDPLVIVRRRLVGQGLVGDGFDSAADVVGWLGAMQAQEYAEAKWSIGQRVRASTDADVEAAIHRGEILRTHVLRPTWHFVTPADIRWLLRLTGPRVQAANRYWYARFGLDDAVLARSHEVLAGVLGDGEARTRSELAAELRRAGIAADGLRLGYLFMHAELGELLCSGPRRGRQQTYALLDQRAGPAPLDTMPPGRARAELVLRYFRSHGPATVRDFTNWSSLTVADARAGLEVVHDQLERHVGEDGTAWFSAPLAGTAPAVAANRAFLVPMYDETVTYRDLRVVLAAEPAAGGLLNRPIVVDGRTVGSWRRTLTARAATVEATLFGALGPDQLAALRNAVERFGRFLEVPVELRTDLVTA